MMLKLAAEYPEYADSAKKVQLVETTSAAYYGKGPYSEPLSSLRIVTVMPSLVTKPDNWAVESPSRSAASRRRPPQAATTSRTDATQNG